MINKTFFPTPKHLAKRMIGKIQSKEPWAMKVLEPSAGKGDLIEILTEGSGSFWNRGACHLQNVSAIESDEDLQATLRGKGIKILDTDFLTYSGPDKFDLIIANPPFDTGDRHLLKAIDIMYRGEIIFLLNAETIRNPYTNARKELAKRLSALNAEIEYIKEAFKDAERQSDVEVALVYIKIERSVEQDLFAGVDDKASEVKPELETTYEVSTRKTIQELVAQYNQTVQIGIETIIGFFKNYKKIGEFLSLTIKDEKPHICHDDLTATMQEVTNKMLAAVRTDFWRRALDIPEVKKRLTSKKQDEFEHQLKDRCDMDFTEKNIRQFVLNLIGSYEQTLMESVLWLFDKFTIKHCWSNGLYDENIHYFNGWKTNKAFKVGKKVILPFYGGYGDDGPFHRTWSGRTEWKVDCDVARELNDTDKTMNYFDGMSGYCSMFDAMQHAFSRGQTKNIESTYFTVTAYKKGTLHMTFNDENILRRFNIAACRGKNWLPHEYGTKAYADMSFEEQAVVDSFEGEKSYSENLRQPLFPNKQLLKIAA